MTSYYKKISDLPMLEDIATASREDLLKSHLRLVPSIINKSYRYDHHLYDDLVQAGNLGLITAVDNYDASRGVKFASYAIPYIHKCVMNYAVDNFSDIRILTTKPIRKAYFNQRKYKTADGKLDRERMSAELGISISDIREMEERDSKSYIHIGLSDTDDEDFFQVPDANSDPALILQQLQYEHFVESDIKESLNLLTDRERFIVENRYFVDEPMTLQALSPIFGISHQRVRQIEQAALAKIKKSLIEKFEACKLEG